MGENMLDFLRSEMLQARLRKDTDWVKAVSTAIGELERTVSNTYVSKEDLVAWAKAQLSAISKSDAKAKEHGQVFEHDEVYEKLLKNMLPEQMSEDDLYDFFTTRCADATSLGQLMATLKASKAGQYDGKLASSVAKSVLPLINK